MFALDGIDWRSWTAADRVAATFLLLKRQYKRSGDTQALRDLYLLVGDKAAVAAIDNQIIHGGQTVQTDR